jgi:hypothetical protein
MFTRVDVLGYFASLVQDSARKMNLFLAQVSTTGFSRCQVTQLANLFNDLTKQTKPLNKEAASTLFLQQSHIIF